MSANGYSGETVGVCLLKRRRMFKKKVAKRNERLRKRFGRWRTLGAICLALSLVIASGAVAHWSGTGSTGKVHGTQKAGEVVPQSFSASSPSKELIYAGSKLVATEEAINFGDVDPATPFYGDILKLARKRVTVGCGTNAQGQPIYCPNGTVTRAEMAVFIERAIGVFIPPTPTGQRFTDVPQTFWAYAFIEDFATRGITAGCTPTTYCPNDTVPHEQMAVFIMRAKGEFNPPTPSAQRFNDVPPGHWAYNFIDRMAVLNIWPGCNPGANYCPASLVTRAEMAHILVQAFGTNWQ
jgi:hypothetical protein